MQLNISPLLSSIYLHSIFAAVTRTDNVDPIILVRLGAMVHIYHMVCVVKKKTEGDANNNLDKTVSVHTAYIGFDEFQ